MTRCRRVERAGAARIIVEAELPPEIRAVPPACDSFGLGLPEQGISMEAVQCHEYASLQQSKQPSAKPILPL
jgi:hypothetical protein